ncbi:MAG: hypothetical protein GY854_18455 [Deltaproteobacteria bacterium]|nr:hypothetical protein [Deltaproteobacteria bacterium]
MARASQGLTISPKVEVKRKRLLPVSGEVLGEAGSIVGMEDVVARALLPGPLHPLNAASSLSVAPAELRNAMLVAEGDSIAASQIIAETSSLFGLFHNRIAAPIDGTVDSISNTTGQVMLRAQPRPLEVSAYLPGKITKVIPKVGVEVTAEVAQVQGIFGLGGETFGTLTMVSDHPGNSLNTNQILDEHQGAVLVGSGKVSAEVLRRMIQVGVNAVVAASVFGNDLIEIVGDALNPASTGNEKIGITLVLTEGFGELSMACHTFELLKRLDGEKVAVNGTTQIRAGVMRPEVIASPLEDAGKQSSPNERIQIGSRVRVVRGSAFGQTGRVLTVPEEPRLLGSGATALVFEIELDSKTKVVVPRPNAELIS